MEKYDEKMIINLLNLKEGWLYGQGVPISEDSVYIAITLGRELNKDHKVEYIESFPAEMGEVILSIGIYNKNILNLIIKSEENILISLENEKEIIDKGHSSLNNIINKINEEILKLNDM